GRGRDPRLRRHQPAHRREGLLPGRRPAAALGDAHLRDVRQRRCLGQRRGPAREVRRGRRDHRRAALPLRRRELCPAAGPARQLGAGHALLRAAQHRLRPPHARRGRAPRPRGVRAGADGSGDAPVSTVRELEPEDWRTWRALRLRALRDAPDAFASTLASTLEREARDGEAYWRGYFTRSGPTLIAEVDGIPAGMARVVVEDAVGPADLFSMWVAPEARGRGVGA